MKIPKLKYYYLALPPDGYQEFEQTRTLPITGITIDVMTGNITGRDHWALTATPALADDIVRQTRQYSGAVYVLRIAAADIDRSLLVPAENQTQVWRYPKTLNIPHCGVYKYELNSSISK